MRSLALLLLVVSFGWAWCTADEALSPEARYRLAIDAMRDVATPPYMRFHLELYGGDTGFTVVRLPDGRAKPYIQVGSPPYPNGSWDVAYRGVDGAEAIALATGDSAILRLALFDPTWHGAYLWLRHGLLATTERTVPSPTPDVLRATPSTEVQPDLIAVVAAFNGGPYRITDGGVARCGGSRPGRRLIMEPLHDPDNYPLRQVVIDDASGRFCTIRFALSATDDGGAYSGYVDVHFGIVGSYYLITDGFIDVRIDIDGSTLDYAHMRFVFSAVSFPPDLPGDTFALTRT